MAKIVGGSPLGTLSGKMGGLVFAHNKSGPYVRQYVVPVNPNTNAQLRARSSFGTAVGSFHSLSPAEKGHWQAFAQTSFNPKDAINVGQFSSINAYTALRTAVIQGNKLNETPTVLKNGVALVTQPSFTPPVFNDNPPVFTVQPNLKEFTTGNAITIGNMRASVNSNGSFELEMDVNPGLTGAPTLAGFKDAVDHNIGIAVFMSNANVQGGLFYQNPMKYLLAYIPFNDADNTDLNAVTTLGFQSDGVITPSDYQDFPYAGQVVRLSVYFMDNSSGTFACIGTPDDADGSNPVGPGDIMVGLAP